MSRLAEIFGLLPTDIAMELEGALERAAIYSYSPAEDVLMAAEVAVARVKIIAKSHEHDRTVFMLLDEVPEAVVQIIFGN